MRGRERVLLMTKRSLLWCLTGVLMFTLFGCSPKNESPKIYYFQIKNMQMHIPQKFAPWDIWDPKNLVNKPPGLPTDSLYFREQDTHTFERFLGQGTGNTNHIWFNLVDFEKRNEKFDFPRSFTRLAWEAPNRDSKNDIHELMAFRNTRTSNDYLNYRYDFKSGETLFISCAHFSMPRPLCFVTTTWRGLQLKYMQSYSDLSEWRDLHTRLITHLDSFIYTP
jgi:hypothetical protein